MYIYTNIHIDKYMSRNLDNIRGGVYTPIFSFKMDRKTREILKTLQKMGENRSEFIRNAILERYESKILGGKK